MSQDRACPSCRKQGRDKTGNHLFLMADGEGWYCNRCGHYEKDSERTEEVEELQSVLETDKVGLELLEEAQSLPFRKEYRGIPAFVAELFEVRMECDPDTGDVACSFYPEKKDGKLRAYKTRKHPKDFSSFPKGGMKGRMDLFGVGTNSNTLILTGGEEDAMAAYTMLLPTNKNADQYDLVVRSLVHGEFAIKDITENMPFIDKFSKVILCLDNDGKTKEKEIAALLGPKVCIMTFSEKDANDMLLEGKNKEFINAFWKAAPYKPEELLWAEDLMDDVYTEDERSPVRYPFSVLDTMLEGMRTKEMVSIIAGTGVGKTTVVHHVLLHVLQQCDWPVGTLCLEEAPKKTLRNMVKVAGVGREEFEMTVKDKLLLLDCWGSNSIEAVSNTIRYMAGMGMKLIVLDHVSMMVADAKDDERRTLDKIMVTLRTLVQELDIHLIVVAHLRRAQGDQGYEDGKQVSLSAIRSSASIAQLSDAVVAVERSTSDNDEEAKSLVQLRILKNRYGGKTGLAGSLKYEDNRLRELLL